VAEDWGTFEERNLSVESSTCAECQTPVPPGRNDPLRPTFWYICGNCKPQIRSKAGRRSSHTRHGDLCGILAALSCRFCRWIDPGNHQLRSPAGHSPSHIQPDHPEDPSNVAFNIGLVLALYGIQIATGFTYETVLLWKYGATLGKAFCQVQVVTAEGKPLSYGLCAARYFAKLLSAFTLLIGYIIAAFDEEKRSLHDRICNTRVIMK
jgi:hypothetical protein